MFESRPTLPLRSVVARLGFGIGVNGNSCCDFDTGVQSDPHHSWNVPRTNSAAVSGKFSRHTSGAPRWLLKTSSNVYFLGSQGGHHVGTGASGRRSDSNR